MSATAPHIVVAEDDPDIRDLVTFKLGQMGFRVTACPDGYSALMACRNESPDAVVADIMMPGMSGLELCQELRGNPDLADVPILLLTARAQQSDVDKGLAAGASDYMVKPFSPRELAARVSALCPAPAEASHA